MADFYHDKWDDASSIEGASQRVQEDTLNLPELWNLAETSQKPDDIDSIYTNSVGLSKSITALPIGEVIML